MIPYKATVLCVSLLTSIMLVAPSALAAYVSIDGSAPIGVSAPMFPVNAQQCQEFSKSAAEQREALVQWHDQCLEANRKGPTARKGAQCTATACEAYHIGRDRFSKLASEEAAACFTAVTVRRAELYKTLGTEENYKQAQKALLEGPYGVAMDTLKRELQEIFRKSKEGADDKSMANGLARRVLPPLIAARKACQSRVPDSAAIYCEKQVLVSVHESSVGALSANRANPAIALWQRAVLERINLQNQDTMRELQRGFSAEGPREEDQSGSLGR